MAVHAARALQHGPHQLERGDRVRRRRGCRGGLRRGRRRVRARGEKHDRSRAGRQPPAEASHTAPNLKGSERSLCLVKAKTAFATAAEIGAVAGSPMPPILASLDSTRTETSGMSGSRSTR